MRSLLLSWALLAAIWGPGVMLVELLILRRISLTAAAIWTAALVSACQALSLESLTTPLGLGTALARLFNSFRSPGTWIPWGLAIASLTWGWLGGGIGVLSAGAVLLALAAAAIFAAAAGPSGALRPARGVALALALLLLLAISIRVIPWLETLPAIIVPGWPPRATRSLALLFWLGAFYSALFRMQRGLAAELRTAAAWLSAAAGFGALGIAARLLPFRLEVAAPGTESLGPDTLLVLVSACLAAAATNLRGGRAER